MGRSWRSSDVVSGSDVSEQPTNPTTNPSKQTVRRNILDLDGDSAGAEHTQFRAFFQSIKCSGTVCPQVESTTARSSSTVRPRVDNKSLTRGPSPMEG